MSAHSPVHRNRVLGLLALVTVAALVLGGNLHGVAAPLPDPIIAGVIELPAEVFLATIDLGKYVPEGGNPKLDSAMDSLASAARVSAGEALGRAESLSLRLSGERVHVQIVVTASGLQAVRDAVVVAGGEITGVGNEDTLMQGWLPISVLELIASRDDVFMIRRPAEAILLEQPFAGASTTEGLAVMNGSAWHAAGHTGAGVKVGIIDGGFQGYTALLGADLPASVTVRNFVDGENDSQVDGTTPHGTACAEVVHDIAPNATIYLAKISTDIDLQEAVAWLKNTHQVNVISISMGWYNLTPGDGTGEFANLVASARSAGILWTTAAGNDRESHWGGPYIDANGNNYHEFDGAEINCFGPGDTTCYNINPGYSFRAFLRWNDWTNVNQDYALLLVRWNGSSWSVIASSNNPQNGAAGQMPTEFVIGTTSGSATAYGVVIARVNSNRNVNLELFVPKWLRMRKILHARSLANLADAPDAITVAALDVNSPYPQESYSSEGPMNGPGGAETGGAIKPDLSGFANVSTQSYGSGTDRFNGTSAATPHVAGAAALVKSAYSDYTPAQIQTFLQGRAIDMGAAGKDTVFGWGRLYLGAPPSISPAPSVTNIAPNSGLNTGSMSVTISGANFQAGATARLTKTGQAAINATGVTVVSPSQITGNFNLTGNVTGAWDVGVTNPDGQSGALLNGFTITEPAPPPIVNAIVPNSGENTGSVAVTISGANFQAGATVKLTATGQPDIYATGVIVVSPSQIAANLNLTGAATGAWNVVVTNPGAQSGTLPNGFTIIFPGKTWTGAISADWHTSGNWTPSGVPGGGDDVVIPAVIPAPVISSGNATVRNLTINSGGILDLTVRTLWVEGTLNNFGTLKQTRDVGVGQLAHFLRITNQVGSQTKYYGLEFTPIQIGAAGLDQAAGEPIYSENLPPDEGSRSVELTLDSLPARTDTVNLVTSPQAPDAPVSLVVDDGHHETAMGVNSSSTGKAHQFIWLNRFTPAAAAYPFTLNEIWVMFDALEGRANVRVGDAIDLVVYQDPDGNPANGANWMATFRESVKAVDGATWSVYALASPLLLNGPGDVLIAVINRYINSGVSPIAYPATIDKTAGQNRSWIGWWASIPPAPPLLPPNTHFSLMTGDSAGNWLIRGYGETQSAATPTPSPTPTATPTVTPPTTPTATATSTPTGTIPSPTPTGTATATPTATSTTQPTLERVTVSISGNQFCAGRMRGVKRCYDINPAASMVATVRFYFSEAERNGQLLHNLLVFGYDGDWEEEPGPYARGGAGDAIYVETQNVAHFSLFALGKSGPEMLYLPLVAKPWPPPPAAPVLNAISNADGDGNYTVSWSASAGANAYTLQEATNAGFSDAATVYAGANTSKAISGRDVGTYYYRVNAAHDYASSGWSNVQSVVVTVPLPPCEQYDFGEANTQYFVYTDGRSWNFTARGNMRVRRVETHSILATSRGVTFTIRVRINGTAVASWTQYVNDQTFRAYLHAADVDFDLAAGDTITYFISANIGGPSGAIRGVSHVKVCR